MRWFWIDRIIEFESGRRSRAIKNVTLAEEHLNDYLPGYPVMPASLIVEGLAQTGGLLVAEHNRFEERVVLAKVSRATFHALACPGETLTYTATIQDVQPEGAIVQGPSHVGERLQAEIDLMFAHLDERVPADLFDDADLIAMLRGLRLYEVGRQADGSRLEVPARLLEAEQRAASGGGA